MDQDEEYRNTENANGRDVGSAGAGVRSGLDSVDEDADHHSLPAMTGEQKQQPIIASPPRSDPSSQQPPAKRRRAVHKTVVTVPVMEAAEGSRARGVGEGLSPPPDSWSWRKYGQKPIKGSPFPRGYYRCSSSKGCPARKQVERSRVDPTLLLITYSFDHNHPFSLASNHGHPISKSENRADPEPADSDPTADGNLADLIAGSEPPALAFAAGSSRWFEDVNSPAEPVLCSTLLGDLPWPCQEPQAQEEEYDSLFAGLGELPECTLVLRRGGGGGQSCSACCGTHF